MCLYSQAEYEQLYHIKTRVHNSDSNGCVSSLLTSQGDKTQTENQAGFELISFLTSCAESISSSDHASINYFMARLGESASPSGQTPTHRLGAYFTEALSLRAAGQWPLIFSLNLPRDLADHVEQEEDAVAFRLLDQATPIPKFIHFTLNQRMMRAFEGMDRVHIIDLDIRFGLQWPSLFQSLASRLHPPSHVRITGVGGSKSELQRTGARLSAIADSLNLPFQFHAVVDQLEDVRLWMLHVKEGECVAVNAAFQLHRTLYDEAGGALKDLLGVIHSANPKIFLLAEEEGENNHFRWEKRFAESLKYYSAIFDALDSSLPENGSERMKIEKTFGRKIRNIITAEGAERFERHESFGKWRRMMEDGGFRIVGIGEEEVIQGEVILRMYSDYASYSLEKKGEDGGGLCLKWREQELYTVSAWAPNPVEAAGLRSAESQRV